jgi:hypothetical protein
MLIWIHPGQTDVVETNGASDENDFLARERAILGDDAEQFATAQDHVATDIGDDLLGGAEGAVVGEAAPEEISGFESSFPAIETQNEVLFARPSAEVVYGALTPFSLTASCSWRYNYRNRRTLPANWLSFLQRARGRARARQVCLIAFPFMTTLHSYSRPPARIRTLTIRIKGSGGRDETRKSPAVQNFRTRRRRRLSRRLERTSTISTYLTTTRRTSSGLKPALMPNNSLPTEKTPLPAAPAGSASRSSSTSQERAQRVVPVDQARSASVSCYWI